MRRLGVVVLAALVAFGGVLVLPAAAVGAAESDGDSSASSDVSVTRYGGADRYETSLQVAEAVAADAGGSLEWVVLVSGRRWTDAVVAAPVAGALGAPVLMTPPGELRADALAFLQRAGISKALVVGPDASGGAHGPGRGVGAEVFQVLDEAGISAERVAGDDLYGTGVAAAGRVTPGAMGELGRTAVIASGEVFADALVAGSFAARGIHPVLLSPPSELHAEVASYLGDAGIEHVVLMGGTAALSDAVEQAVEDLGIDVSRVAGSTRYATAVKAAEFAENQYSAAAGMTCFANDTIGVARARVPFDSFSAAPLLGRLCAPLVLADPDKIPDDTAAFLDAARDQYDAVGLRVFGGDAAVSQAAIDTYLAGTEASTDAGAVQSALPAGTCGGSVDDKPGRFLPSIRAESPAWSPDCSQLVYTQDGSLWQVNNDGSGRKQLVAADGSNRHSAVWSPLGDRIAYVSDVTDNTGQRHSHIWTVNADGSHNNQRTEGDLLDRWPTWSPDGSKIAFSRRTGIWPSSDRYLVVMTSFGNKPKALLQGGPWEDTPAWSPDGSKIAFESAGGLWLVDTDGSNVRHIHSAVQGDTGLTWSPDGTRIAFVHYVATSHVLVAADVDGYDEEVILEVDLNVEGRLHSPRWSPDGTRIAFHIIDRYGRRSAYLSGASGEPALFPADCRPRGPLGVVEPTPLYGRLPAVGTARIGVLFMDFPDAVATHSAREEAEFGLPWVERYLEAASYGRLDIEFVPLYRWLRAEQPSTAYLHHAHIGARLDFDASAEAVELADAEVDFSTLDLVMTVFPSSHFGSGSSHGTTIADDDFVLTARANLFPRNTQGLPQEWGTVAAREVAHILGLHDLDTLWSSQRVRRLGAGQTWARAFYGLMGLDAEFPTAVDDERYSILWEHPDGSTRRDFRFTSGGREMLGWTRWQLGWLEASQVHCDSGAGATVSLAPIAQPGDGVALAVVPLTSHDVIVIESRRAVGYDTGQEWVNPDTRVRTTFPGLVSEGVLVYTVDSFIGTGELPVKVAGDSGNSEVDDFPVIGLGESVTLHGYTITVTADNGSTHTVSITRSN